MYNSEGRNSGTSSDKITRRSSWFFLNSASVLEESHATLYSSAISLKTLSFTSPDGALTESFSIIWNNNIKRRDGIMIINNSYYSSTIDSCSLLRNCNWRYFTMRFTPESGRSSDTAETNSFPYLVVNKFLMCNKSGTSEHLGAAKIILAMASRNSGGHSLLCGEERLQVWLKEIVCCEV